jgi:hypothetical protein
MHDQPKQAPTDLEDLHDEFAVFTQVVTTHPAPLRLSDLIRELGDAEDFASRDRIERALRALIKVGLLFRRGSMIFPTRAALHAYEVLSS